MIDRPKRWPKRRLKRPHYLHKTFQCHPMFHWIGKFESKNHKWQSLDRTISGHCWGTPLDYQITTHLMETEGDHSLPLKIWNRKSHFFKDLFLEVSFNKSTYYSAEVNRNKVSILLNWSRIWSYESAECTSFSLLPSQIVLFPVQNPLAWQRLISEPFKINPSSHWNDILLGKVDIFPFEEPLTGVRKGPQSLAARKV